MKRYILVIDAGTTSVRALVFDHDFHVAAIASSEIRTIVKSVSIIEQDAAEIFDKCVFVCREALKNGNIDISEVACLAITNQRATSLPWDKETGMPLRNAINWADCRAEYIVDRIIKDGWMERVEDVMMRPNYMFANLHFAWFIENDALIRSKMAANELCYGTLDSYLIYRLTKGKRYITTYSNVSAYTGFNLKELHWQEDYLAYLGIPVSVLPTVSDDTGDLGCADACFLGAELPIAAVYADQQAGSYAHRAVSKGMLKCTIGTGAFCDLCVGEEFIPAPVGLLPHVTYKIGNDISFQIEGYVTSAGSTVQWLRDNLKMIDSYDDIKPLVDSVSDSGGVFFIPALAGLGAPDWEADATGLFIGLSRDSKKGHLMRAVLDGIACRIRDIRDRMTLSCDCRVNIILVDGGVTKSDYLCQTIADLLQVRVERAKLTETTSLGAAEIAGVNIGFWTVDDVDRAAGARDVFEPCITTEDADAFYTKWLRAKEHCRHWY